jgi:2-polyprenyl-3-methyl-5-hydroxy-6-metoxy-1,4-benzoquinol methylase
MRCLAVIQANHTDLLPGDMDPGHYCISALKKSKYVEKIVIAAPDTPENRIFTDLAKLWGIDCFLGYELDVVKRIICAAENVGADKNSIIARVLLNRFYLDIEMIDKMFDLIEEKECDYIILPYNFDINFGADVLTLNCLRRVDLALNQGSADSQRFRPWLFIEEHPESFETAVFEDVPSYPFRRLEEIRSSGLFSERDCGTFSYFTYKYIEEFLDQEDVVLDIACGIGEGSAILAQKCSEVIGADLSSDSIMEAKAAHILPNLNFEVQDGCNMTYPSGRFSAIVCMNTLEHVEDDRQFLENCHRALMDDGLLILEVPLLRQKPFNFPLISSHLREYKKDDLIDLISSCRFEVKHLSGMNRGQYVEWRRARESALVVAYRKGS